MHTCFVVIVIKRMLCFKQMSMGQYKLAKMVVVVVFVVRITAVVVVAIVVVRIAAGTVLTEYFDSKYLFNLHTRHS